MSDLILYELPGCPYCAKVINKLDELGLEYESREVPRSHSELTDVEEVSGETGVLVLIVNNHDIVAMPDIADLVAHLEANYGS